MSGSLFRHRFWLVVPICLFGLVWWRFYDLAGAYWRADDPALLNHALQSPGLAAFWDPDHWRQLSANNLTPWVTLSLKLDLALWGLSPMGFYVHQLLSLGATGWVGFALLRRFTTELGAFFAVVLFLLGAPAGAVTDTLTTRHYLEGLMAALLALESFFRAHEATSLDRRLGWQAAALVAYAVACTAKEIYVPLPLLVLSWPGLGSFRDRVQKVLPFFLVLGAYVLWRRYMLGGYVGGYGEPSALIAREGLLAFAEALGRFPSYLWGANWRVPVVLVLILGLRFWRAGPWLLLVGALVLGPLLPLVAFPGLTGPDRYLFLPWFVLCALMGVSLPRWVPTRFTAQAPRLVAVGTLVGAAALAWPTGLHEWAQRPLRNELAQAFEQQGRYLWAAPSQDVYRPTDALAQAFWYAHELCSIRARLRDPCPRALLRGLDVGVPETPVLHLQDGRMRPLDPAVLDEWLQVDRVGALSAEFDLTSGMARWRFGPHEAGHYFLVSPLLGRYRLPREGHFKVAQKALSFHLVHEDASGRVTASPLLHVALDQPLRWRR